MASLDAAVVCPQQAQGHYFGCGHRDCSSLGPPWSDATGISEWDPFLLASLVQAAEEWGAEQEEEVGFFNASPPESAPSAAVDPSPVTSTTTKRKRGRTKALKNEEEMESQRMAHIAVERNRRRQMNEYLAVLRSLMPPSYAQRGDQASIVGGAINYVRELEQLLQSLEVQRCLKERNSSSPSPFAAFFSFPQYSTTTPSPSPSHGGDADHNNEIHTSNNAETTPAGSPRPSSPSVAAEIEASMLEGHASVKVQAPRRPRQLLRLAEGLQHLGLTTLHLNVSTAGTLVMYSFSLKEEDECKLSSVEEIAAAVHEILGRVQEDTGFC